MRCKGLVTYEHRRGVPIMKKGKLFLAAVLATTMGCQSTAPAQADVSVHIGFGGPRAVAYHPVYYGDYFYNTAYAPNLLFIPQLGFYVSVGLPYDLLFFNNFYYVYHHNHWYHSHYYHGPWVVVKHNRLPHAIKKHRWHKIREYSNYEYRKAHKHRWLKHRHYVHKEKRKSIRNSAHYHPASRHSEKVYSRKSGYEERKFYKERTRDNRKKAYRNQPENKRRQAYKVRTERERKKTYRVKSEPEKRVIRTERKRTKTWRNTPGEQVVVKERTTKTKRWTKQKDNSKERYWAKKENRNRFKGEMKRKFREREASRTAKRWARVKD